MNSSHSRSMIPSNQVEYSLTMKSVLTQFIQYCSTPDNLALIGSDQSELSGILMDASAVKGFVGDHLTNYPELLTRASWYFNKYKGLLSEASRDVTITFNTFYVKDRANGYDEWSAKRRCEILPEYLTALNRKMRLEALVNHLASCLEVVRARLIVLEQLSNNQRMEMRLDHI